MDSGFEQFVSGLGGFIEQYFEYMLAASALMFIATLVLIPAVIIRIPEDYFCYQKRHRLPARRPLVRMLVFLLKNLLGALLLVTGLVMLVTPGQGVLTLLLGLMIMDYPGKYALERWLIRRLRLLPALNWVRRRHGKSPLVPPSGATDARQAPDQAADTDKTDTG